MNDSFHCVKDETKVEKVLKKGLDKSRKESIINTRVTQRRPTGESMGLK
ncbi:hypothetical protein NE664_07250 [Anaerotignum faecicola]|nr:hypothetical protein [Anaerotignum faecicola]